MATLSTSPRRTLAVLCVVSVGWAVSFGLGAPLASLWLKGHGCSPSVLGLNTAAYYAGIALTAVAMSQLMGRSVRGCVLAGLILSTLTTALFPVADGLAWWFVLRALGGAGTALFLIPLETLVNHNAPPQRRARDFGYYASAVALGIGIGSVAGLSLYAVSPRLAFALGGVPPLLASFAAWRYLPRGGLAEESAGDGNGSLSMWGNFLGFGTAWVQGFLEGGMVTFLSVYLTELGHSDGAAGGLMGVLFLGVIGFQIPVALLADRRGRVRVLLACHAVVLGVLVLLPGFTAAVPLGGLLFLVGGCCAALYPLGLSLLGERLPAGVLGRANAWYLAWNCAGSLSGPVVMGLAMDLGVPHALFATGATAVVLVLAGSALSRPAAAVAVERPADSATTRRAA